MPIINMVYKKKKGWKPWANTRIYYKFDWNLNDSSWNGNNWTAWWTVTYWTNYANLVSWYVTVPNLTYNNTYTLSFWFKCTNLSQWTYIVDWRTSSAMFFRMGVNWTYYFFASTDYPSWSWVKTLQNPADNNWHLFTQTSSSSWVTYYLDWIQKATSSAISSGSYTMNWMRIGKDWNGGNNNPWLYAWAFIVESVARTADEIAAYYNQTVWNYITSRLPSEYQEVEYIESSWTQKINTWYTTNSNMRVVCEFYTTNTANDNVIFATENWSWAWSNYILCFTNNTDFLIGTNSETKFTGTPLSTKHKVDFSLSSITLDSTTITKSSSVGTYNISLFQWNTKAGKVRIYSFKAYTWTTLERDLVPCYRKNDSVIWMYDLVNNTFYTNAWSWTFTKWPDV
jgi:hypothetical protein